MAEEIVIRLDYEPLHKNIEVINAPKLRYASLPCSGFWRDSVSGENFSVLMFFICATKSSLGVF